MASLPLWALTRLARATREGGPKAPFLATTLTAVTVTAVSDEYRRAEYEGRAEPSRRRCGMMRARRGFGARRSSPSRSCRRPDARSGRVRARPLPSAFALLLGALCLLPAAPAAAQNTVLVSNIGMPKAGDLSTNGHVQAQGFTTGSASGGYTLSSIETPVGSTPDATERATMRAELWSETGGRPDSKVADLTVPSTVTAGTSVSFAAPANTALSANTTYFFVLYTTGTYNPVLTYTNSTSEDNGQAGWSIANGRRYVSAQQPGGGTFKSDNRIVRIRVNGPAATDAPPVWSATLTVDEVSWGFGCSDGVTTLANCSTALDDNNFTVEMGGTTYTVGLVVLYRTGANAGVLAFGVGSTPSEFQQLALRVNGETFSFANASIEHNTYRWSSAGLSWSDGQSVSLSLVVPTVTDPPGAPVGLAVTPGSSKLDLEWTEPSGSPTSYDVHYTSSTSAADDAAVGTTVATEWVDAGHTGAAASKEITSLANDTTYRVRVRGVNAVGAGAWAWGSGTPKSATSGSTNARLSALVVKNYSTILTLDPAFSATTYAYAVPNVGADNILTVTPTVSQADATVRVGMGTSLTAVASDSASSAIDLALGSNVITVEVTAQAGNKRIYTITVTRDLPVLDWRFATATRTEDRSVLSELQLSYTIRDHDISGTFSYAAGATHPASLADDVGSGRPTEFTEADVITVPIVDDALNEEDETFTITIEPGTGYTVGSPSVHTVTITDNDPPAAPGTFQVAPGNTELRASWSKPEGPVAGYQLRWKTAAAPDTAVTDGSGNTSLGWVEGGEVSSSSLSQTITSLANDSTYHVQVRATDGQTATGNGYGAWTATQEGTPQTKTYGFSPSNYDGTPGSTFNVTVSLSEAAPSGGLALTVTRLFGTALPAGLCTTGAQLVLAEADDIAAGQPTSVTVQPGQTQASFSFTFAKNGDDLVGRGECFGLQLGTGAAGWTAGESAVAKFEIMIGHLQAHIAMGSNAAATATHTRAVAENVTGDTLKVPVTVDALPYQSTTFAIEVLSGSTATENTDFGIATKSVTFGPTTPKTQNLTVSITDDAEVEADETIELRLADGPGTLSVNDAYRRHAQGRLATITIQSEDAVPGAVRDLAIASSDTTLAVSWRVPASAGSSALTGYDVHYTSSSTVPDDADVGTTVASEWVDAGHTGTTPLSMDITPLTNGTTYRVRVRAVNGSGGGAWERGTGTPSETPSVSLAASPNPVGEGSNVTVTATLSRALTSSVTIPVMVERGTSESGDHGTLANITVAANATTGTGTITTAHDADADDETFKVELDADNLPSSVVEGSPSEVEVTITDDEKPTVSLSASPDPVTEGEPVTITATLTAALSTSVTIPVTVERVSSEAGDHGTLTSITVNANATTGTGTITTAHDTGEEDETFRVALGSPLPAAVLEGSPSEVLVRIADDEGIPAVTLAADPNPVDEGSGVTVTATLSKVLASSVTIPVTVERVTSEAGDHGTLSSITVSSGATSGEGTIRTNQDTDTDHETFTVEVDTGNLPQAVRAGDPDSVLVTITDDDKAEVTLAASPNPVNEGSAVTVTARLSKALPSAVTIPLSLSRGTAEEGDYGALESITVRAGRRSATGTVTTVRDEDEEDETFTVALGSPLPSSVFAGDPSSVEVTIRDDGPLRAELESSTLRPSEGSSARLTATLNHPAPAGGVRVRFHGDGGEGDNPASPVGDFTLAPAPAGESVTDWIDIAEGDRRATGWLRVVNDDEPEDDETVAVWLDGSWTDDTPEIELTIPANDGGGGTGAAAWIDAEPNPVTEGRDVTIRVHLTKPLDADATIPLTVRRGTSEEGDHGTLDEVVIAAGETVGRGTIETTRDDDPDDETFTVRLGSPLPTGVRAGAASSVEVVIDDRDEPRAWLEVEPNPVDEGDPVTVTAKLDGVLTRSVTIPIEVERVTSEQGDHGTLSSIRIASGRTEGTGRITTTRDDDGDDEEFTVSLGAELPSGVERGHPESVEVVIVDEGGDAPAIVSLGAAPDPVPEGESVTVTATLDKALERTVTIPVTVERGTSEAGDHGSLSGIRIASGQVEGTGTITTRVDDDTDDETFTVALRTNLPAGVEAGIPSSFEVTIADRGGEVPGRVRSLRVTAGDGRLDLTWSAPSSGTVTAYVTAYKKRSASEWIQLHEDDYQDTKAAIEALENDTRYDVRVRASNDYGDGPWATGSGTPTGGGGSTGLRSLSVRVSKEENGPYRSVSLSPSFRSSVTAYRVTAPAGTEYAKFRPTAASSTALILVHGHEVASGAESPAIFVSTGVAYWTAVIDNSEAKEYSVTFTIPSASMDAARSSVTAAVDAALAVVGTLSPEDAAGALLGERSLEEDRLEALDRLGNANGRYDVGDLLAWIERCRLDGARCGDAPRTSPPASDAALPGAVGAAAARRPRRRAPGGRKPQRRRSLRGLAVALAAALWSCDGAGVVDLPAAADVPVPGTLAVEWTAPTGGPAAAGALVEIDGPDVGDARAPGGLELYAAGQGNGPRRFVIAGEMRNGTVLEFQVPDRRQAGLYSVRVVEVAGEDHRLLEPDGYRAGIAAN